MDISYSPKNTKPKVLELGGGGPLALFPDLDKEVKQQILGALFDSEKTLEVLKENPLSIPKLTFTIRLLPNKELKELGERLLINWSSFDLQITSIIVKRYIQITMYNQKDVQAFLDTGYTWSPYILANNNRLRTGLFIFEDSLTGLLGWCSREQFRKMDLTKAVDVRFL